MIINKLYRIGALLLLLNLSSTFALSSCNSFFHQKTDNKRVVQDNGSSCSMATSTLALNYLVPSHFKLDMGQIRAFLGPNHLWNSYTAKDGKGVILEELETFLNELAKSSKLDLTAKTYHADYWQDAQEMAQDLNIWQAQENQAVIINLKEPDEEVGHYVFLNSLNKENVSLTDPYPGKEKPLIMSYQELYLRMKTVDAEAQKYRGLILLRKNH